MVGFDVTPEMASSRIIRSSSPLCRSCRERKSSQTLWPSSETCCSRVSAMVNRLHIFDLFESPSITLAPVEPRLEERAHEVGRELCADDLRAQAKDVHVV